MKKVNKNNEDYLEDVKLTKSLETNIELFKEIFADDETVKFRRFENKATNKVKCCVIFIDGMIERETINEHIILPIVNTNIEHLVTVNQLLDIMINKVIYASEITKVTNVNKMVGAILYGETALLFDGIDEGIYIDTKGWERRAIEPPLSEGVVRGPREGFTESIITNLSLIRRKIRHPGLKFKFKEIGTRTKTKICVCYIEELVHKKILNELIERLDAINIDGILESGYIEELIRDEPFSPFHTIGYTERPDDASASLLEGKIAVICDGTPFVLTLPFVFQEYFQASEDYYSNFIFSSINRGLRYLGFFLSSSVPAIYLALVTFHQEMIPTPLLLSISTARQGVPFPAIVETIGMLLIFEILREAGTRLPKPIGQTISIVGALVLGEAAVTAKIISAPIVIVTALTGITSFLTPKMIGPLLPTRFILVVLSALLGLYGYAFGVMGLGVLLMSMRSFGVPYMLNMGSFNGQDIKDTAIRAPWWVMYYRPKLIGSRNIVRRRNYKG